MPRVFSNTMRFKIPAELNRPFVRYVDGIAKMDTIGTYWQCGVAMDNIPDRECALPPLEELLATALRHARVGQGYEIQKIDRAIAMALLVESAQRAAEVAGGSADQMPEPHVVAEIFNAVLDDIRQEAADILRVRYH